MSAIYFNGTDADPLENPLAQFKSYSYYHVLAVCDSTQTAKNLSEVRTDVTDTWLHPGYGDISTPEQLGPWAPKTLPGGGSYCVLINGATDASMVITSVKFQTLASAGAANNDRFTSLAVEGSIEVSEPKGISFLDIIARCCAALGKDAAHVTFILKTFFIGYNSEDSVQTITTVAPLAFVVIDVTGSFTESGGQYKMDFVALSNGVSRLPQYDKMLKSTAITGKTLTEVVSNMQSSVDRSYEKMYNCIAEQVSIQEKALGYDPGEIGNKLRRVKYKIELADLYKTPGYDFVTPAQTSTNGTCGNTAKEGSDGTSSTGTDSSLESALHHMMQHCEKVANDAKTGITSEYTMKNGKTLKVGTKMSYKIHTNLESEPPGSPTKDPQYTVTYRVEPFPSPRALIGVTAANASPEDQQTKREILDPNTIEFEYVYTGRNIDILEFDMKINMGLAYLQIATLSNTYKDQGEILPSIVTTPDIKQISAAGGRTSKGMAAKPVDIPVFFSTNMELPANKTNRQVSAKAGEMYDMAKHSSVEVLDVNMKITGNLTLLQSTVNVAGPQLGSSQVDKDTMDWGYVPGFAKVHIMMPSLNDDIGLFEGKYNGYGYAKDFWFKGYYFILGVEHQFSDGEFTQQLTMVGMPEPVEKDKNDVKSAQEGFSAKVGNCYAGTGCPPTTPNNTPKTHDTSTVVNSPVVVAAKTQPVAQVPSKQIDTVIRDMSETNVDGWNKMDEKVKQAITTETKGDKISLSTYAAIASIESRGNPGAVSPTGAAGIFQFTRKTWNSTMPGHPVSSTTPSTEDPRRDPNLNAQAARIYLNQVSKTLGNTTDPTWLYMGHNLGPGAARSVMNYQRAGNTDKLMSDVYAEHPSWKPQWAEFARANGYSQDATVSTVRDQIAGKFAKRVKGINVTEQATAKASELTPTAAGQAAAAANTVVATPPSPSSNRLAGEMITSVDPKCKPDVKEEEKKADDCSKDKQSDTSEQKHETNKQ